MARAGGGPQTIDNCTDSGTAPTTDPAACTGAGTHNPATNVLMTVVYDGAGGVIKSTSAVGTGAAEATTETAYDAAGQAVAVKDPQGTTTRSFYAAGRLSKTVVNCTDAGTTIPTAWPECTGDGTSDGTWNLTTLYAYDSRGNRVTETAPNGRVTTSVYDGANRLIATVANDVVSPIGPADDVTTSYFYDDTGRQSAVKSPTKDGSSFVVTRHFFDEGGRLIREVRNCTNTGEGESPPTEPGTCNGGGTGDADTNVTTDYAYDTNGHRTKVTEADPSATGGTGFRGRHHQVRLRPRRPSVPGHREFHPGRHRVGKPQ